MGYMGLVVAAAPQYGMGAAVKQQIVQITILPACAQDACAHTTSSIWQSEEYL